MANKFYAQKDALGFPILGTMMCGNRVPKQDNIIEISTSTGLGKHPKGFKYYVRKDSKGRILVNSMFVSYDPQPASKAIDLHVLPGLPLNCVGFTANTLDGHNFYINIQSYQEDYTATVTWGDGQVEAFPSNEGQLYLQHNYSPTAEFNGMICFDKPNVIHNLTFPGND